MITIRRKFSSYILQKGPDRITIKQNGTLCFVHDATGFSTLQFLDDGTIRHIEDADSKHIFIRESCREKGWTFGTVFLEGIHYQVYGRHTGEFVILGKGEEKISIQTRARYQRVCTKFHLKELALLLASAILTKTVSENTV